MTFAELLTIIMLSCGSGTDNHTYCQKELLRCVMKFQDGDTSAASNKRALNHCIMVTK